MKNILVWDNKPFIPQKTNEERLVGILKDRYFQRLSHNEKKFTSMGMDLKVGELLDNKE